MYFAVKYETLWKYSENRILIMFQFFPKITYFTYNLHSEVTHFLSDLCYFWPRQGSAALTGYLIQVSLTNAVTVFKSSSCWLLRRLNKVSSFSNLRVVVGFPPDNPQFPPWGWPRLYKWNTAEFCAKHQSNNYSP